MKRIVFLASLLIFVLFPGLVPAVDTGYKVGEGDVLKVTVYDNPDLTSVVRVSSAGTIHFPLIGQVEIAGLTGDEVAEKIASDLAEGYVLYPQVSVFIEEFHSKKAIINGQVEKPGLYGLSGPTTLSELISLAGGLKEDAGDTITVRRNLSSNAGEEQFITVNRKSLMEQGNTEFDLTIQDGDSIFVTKVGTVYVTGQVNKPNIYPLEDQTSVIKAITMAGGFADLAAKGRVKIIRKVEGSEKVLENVPMHTPVLPDDVIVVPESLF